MKKNVVGQSVGAQLISAADGSEFTGSVTVYVTGDAGTQAIGSVGSGACVNEGHGFYTYAPAQAETNYDLVAFTFVGTGAITATVQYVVNFPQVVDLQTGITAGTIATVTTLTNLPGITANWLTAAGIAAGALNGKGDWLLSASYTAPVNLTAAQIATGVWTDTIAGDFTTALSIGKSVMNGVALGTGLTINAYTGNTVQTGDSFARLGAPAGASHAADTAAIKSDSAAILGQTGTTGVKLATDSVDAAAIAATGASEIATAVGALVLAELTGVPSATPALKDAIMLLYMSVRNKRDTIATTDTICNSAGSTIATAAVSDDTVTFEKGKYA